MRSRRSTLEEEERTNELLRYETTASPRLKATCEIYFSAGSGRGETKVREVMNAPLGRLGRAALALIGKYPTEEVHANLHRFKEIMETGKVNDTTFAVKGKFARQFNSREPDNCVPH